MRRIALCLFPILYSSCAGTRITFEREVTQARHQEDYAPRPLVTEADLAPLPPPVQRYLRYTGIVGKPKASVVRLRQSGQFKTSLEADWKPLAADQFYFPRQHAFFWHGTVFMNPLINARARDKYSGGKGNVWVRVAHLINVADSKGPQTDISCLVRYFNELVWFPTAFVDSAIQWKAVDDSTAIAILHDQGMRTQATLHFNASDEMVLFESDDRYAMINGSMVRAPWRTPMRQYREFHGIKIPTEGEAIYRLPQGDFEYARIRIEDVDFDSVERPYRE